jgi:RNA polymerase sigma-70 factor, ECF subfamily
MTTTTGESVLHAMNIATSIARSTSPPVRRYEKAPILIPDDRMVQPDHRSRRSRPRPTAPQDEVLQEVFLASRKQLFRVAFRILKNEEDAEDAVQDAMISAFRNFGKFEHRSQITTWLTRIVVNAALMIHRKRKSAVVWSLQEECADDTVFAETIPDHQPNPEHAYQRTESLASVDALLNEMNPLLQQAVKAAYYEELSTAEASSALAVPVSTFKARLFRGTHLLQKKVRKQRNNIFKTAHSRQGRGATI